VIHQVNSVALMSSLVRGRVLSVLVRRPRSRWAWPSG